ncbi:MAG: hypothetical protein ACKOF3_08630 [Spartobacteria bacterium]
MKERGALEIGQAGVVDAAAWWTFDDQQIAESQSIGDETGNGNTLFVEGTRVTPVPGTLGGAFEFAPGQGNLRLLDPKKLAMGAGDYAVSLWIKRTASTAMAGRIFDFGGGTRALWMPTSSKRTFGSAGRCANSSPCPAVRNPRPCRLGMIRKGSMMEGERGPSNPRTPTLRDCMAS